MERETSRFWFLPNHSWEKRCKLQYSDILSTGIWASVLFDLLTNIDESERKKSKVLCCWKMLAPFLTLTSYKSWHRYWLKFFFLKKMWTCSSQLQIDNCIKGYETFSQILFRSQHGMVLVPAVSSVPKTGIWIFSGSPMLSDRKCMRMVRRDGFSPFR